jgi:TM2 domain-containing membrane protein YozV
MICFGSGLGDALALTGSFLAIVLVVYIGLVIVLPIFLHANARKKGLLKSKGTAYILLLSGLGVFGVHRFYAGRVGTGMLWLFTGGLFGIGLFFDLFLTSSMIDDVNRQGQGQNIYINVNNQQAPYQHPNNNIHYPAQTNPHGVLPNINTEQKPKHNILEENETIKKIMNSVESLKQSIEEKGILSGYHNKKPYLIGIIGEYRNSEINMMNDTFTFGRDLKNCQILFNSAKSFISRVHCAVKFNKNTGKFNIIDYSSNGTYLINGSRLTREVNIELESGSGFYFGNRNEVFEVRLK